MRNLEADFLFRFGRLFKEYICLGFVTMENQCLKFPKNNQGALRADSYKNVKTMIDQMVPMGNRINKDDHNLKIGRRIVLSKSFVGSPRWYSQFQDGMAIMKHSWRNPEDSGMMWMTRPGSFPWVWLSSAYSGNQFSSCTSVMKASLATGPALEPNTAVLYRNQFPIWHALLCSGLSTHYVVTWVVSAWAAGKVFTSSQDAWYGGREPASHYNLLFRNQSSALGSFKWCSCLQPSSPGTSSW